MINARKYSICIPFFFFFHFRGAVNDTNNFFSQLKTSNKSSVWQHVDCMGIDRQNIPEEYKCELCQPRTIDQNRARTLQLMKNKKEDNLDSSKLSQSSPTDLNSLQIGGDRSQLNTFSTIVANKKKGTLSSKSRKSDKNNAVKKQRSETKKSLQLKRKLGSSSNTNTTSATKSSTANESDTQLANLRQWIENYEIAMTNHYSPELRARLHSIPKPVASGAYNAATLKNHLLLDSKCTTVPHAGAKILISTNEISPNNPVIEIRGKYMLTTQFRAQFATNLPIDATPPPAITTPPSPANTSASMSKLNPGPFVFFYRLPNDGLEVCVDTRTYGNDARFVRRSCRPNAKIVHTIEKGIPHLYIVSLNTIRASTEITVKHETHDLDALASNEISAPTSTVCGCGLIKDCIFGANPSTLTLSIPTKKAKRPNGHMKAKTSSLARKKQKLEKSALRRPSGSGESNIGLQSPIKRSKSQEVVTNDSCSDTGELHKEPSTSDKDSSDNRTKLMEQHSTLQSANTTPVKSNNDDKFDGSIPKVALGQPISGNLKSPGKSGSQKKAARKSTYSFSEDTGDETTRKEKEPKKQVEQRKLSREERKMEAYMRAFEKMERTEQRKNEANKHKSTSIVHSPSIMHPTKKRLSLLTSGKDKNDKVALRKAAAQQNKRKRKRPSKSYNQASNQKRRRNRSDSHNSDITSDENITPLMSPIHSPNARNCNNDKRDLAAGMLLSLSSFGLSKDAADNKNCVPSITPYSTNKLPSNTPQIFPINSPCSLLEGAITPTETDFKLPAKTKTKKAMMNEWLNQSDGSGTYSPNRYTSSSMMENASPTADIKLAAQKIADFINMTSNERSECGADDDESNKLGDIITVPTPLPTPPLQTGSSVKKR